MVILHHVLFKCSDLPHTSTRLTWWSNLSLMVTGWCVLFLFTIYASAEDSCSSCRYIAKQFNIEFERTSGKTFVGGNTLWEKKNIGTYATSETRFHDIVDNICNKSEKKCHLLLESLEDSLDSWWGNKSNFDNVNVEIMEDYLCIRNGYCCHYGHFGSNCIPCLPCFVNGGLCDGNGTRTGSGRCVCHNGYTGDSCGDCKNDTHFHSTTESDPYICEKCHLSCFDGCNGPTASDCVNCKQGWVMNTSLAACVDVNECNSSPCAPQEVCINTLGSYKCDNCHHSCLHCHGTTANDCDQCAKGYVMSGNGKCDDIDECNEFENICGKASETCRNTEGSYSCECIAGYNRKDGACIAEGTTQDSVKQHRRPNKSQRIIWTVSFLKEFSKYAGALLAFCFFYYLSRKNSILVCGGAILLGSFLYSHSIILDKVFLKQR